MISVARFNNKLQYGIYEYILDTEDDVANLPTDTSVTAMGSTAFVIATSKKYMINSSGEWKEISTEFHY